MTHEDERKPIVRNPADYDLTEPANEPIDDPEVRCFTDVAIYLGSVERRLRIAEAKITHQDLLIEGLFKSYKSHLENYNETMGLVKETVTAQADFSLKTSENDSHIIDSLQKQITNNFVMICLFGGVLLGYMFYNS